VSLDSPSTREACLPLTSDSSSDLAAYRNVLSNFASGVVIVTAEGRNGPVGMTFQSFFSVSLEPPLVAISPSRTSQTWREIRQAGAFCVNVLQRKQTSLCQVFGTRSNNRFEGISWSAGARTGAPVLEGCLAWLECDIDSVHEAGDHFLVVARVLGLAAARGEPLVVYRRALGSFQV